MNKKLKYLATAIAALGIYACQQAEKPSWTEQETERIDSRFLEPACGDGNFLAEILTRKMAVVKKKYKKRCSKNKV